MYFEEHLRKYQKVVLTYFLKKIYLRLSRTQPTIYNLQLNLNLKKFSTSNIVFKKLSALRPTEK
jgi:hypothetical protein